MAEPMKGSSSHASITIPPGAVTVPPGVAPPPNTATVPVDSAAQPAKLRARVIGAERTIGKLLRTGAMLSVGLFGLSMLAEALPASTQAHVAIDFLRKGGLVVLVLTPLARLTAAGAVLAAKGEWRYAMYGAGVLLLLAFALGAGFGV